MESGIELHDSELCDVTFDGASVVTLLLSASLHHAGSGWRQDALFTFRGASPVTAPADLPAWIIHDFLRLDGTRHNDLLPVSLAFDGPVDFSLTFVTAETLSIQAQHISIKLLGEPSYVEPLPWAEA